MTAVGVADVMAKCGDFDFEAMTGHENNAKLGTDSDAFRKNFQNLVWGGVGGDVVVDRFSLEKDIAHTTACEQRLKAALLQSGADRIRQFAGLHGTIMLHTVWKWRKKKDSIKIIYKQARGR